MTIQVTITAQTPNELQKLLKNLAFGTEQAAIEVNIETPPKVAPVPVTTSPVATVATAPASEPKEQPAETPSEPESEPEMLISAAVMGYARDCHVDLNNVIGTGKNGRIIKSDITAAIRAAVPEPEAEEDDPFAIDEPVVLPAATKADVRVAMVAYQEAVRENLIDDGSDEDDAAREAMQKARNQLEVWGGAGTLGGIAEADYAKVVAKAVLAKASL